MPNSPCSRNSSRPFKTIINNSSSDLRRREKEWVEERKRLEIERKSDLEDVTEVWSQSRTQRNAATARSTERRTRDAAIENAKKKLTETKVEAFEEDR